MSKNKYRAHIVKSDGHTFDSKAEFKRFCELKLLLHAKKIINLDVHPRYRADVNDIKICDIEMDFRYIIVETNQQIVEDVKGFDTPISKLKRRLLKALYPDLEINILTAR
jgi:hypothetical protein